MIRCISIALVATALALEACSSGASPDRAVERPEDESTIGWDDCGFDTECAYVSVPLDYTEPAGEELKISVTRRRAAEDSDWAGVLVVNWGGPGASGLDAAYDAEYYFPREVLDHFDIIGFDPRGIGESGPVNCGEDPGGEFPTDLTPDEDAERAIIVDNARLLARACVSRNRDQLPYINTTNTARDMDRIREALGVAQISYFGQSYGTVLGAVYADMYPDHVRAMVLDGAVDTSLDFAAYHGEQARSFDRALDSFLDGCQRRRSCDFYSGGDPHEAYDELIAELEDESLDAALYDDSSIEVTQADAQSAVLSSMYDSGYWIQLSLALVEAHRDKDGSLLLDLAYPPNGDDGSSEVSGAAEAIFCGDLPAPRDVDEYHTLSDRLQAIAPRVGAIVAYWYVTCAFLPEPIEPLDGPYDAAGAPPILVVGATGDAATPYEWSVAMARQLDSAQLLTYRGSSHAVVFSTISSCVDDAAVRYLIDLALPRPGAAC